MSRRHRYILCGLGVVDLIILAVAVWVVASGMRSPALPTRISPPSTAARLTATLLPLTSPNPPVFPSPTVWATTVESTESIASSCVVTATGGLVTEVRAIVAAMPGAASEGMSIPTNEQLAVWESLTRAVAEGDTRTACALIQANRFPYQLVDFTDLRYNNERYLILRENLPVSVGWGTYVFRMEERINEAIIEVPHPLADERTEAEGVELFRHLHARALLIAGAHRCADAAFSPCIGQTVACNSVAEPYRVSDVAHAIRTTFQAAHRALVECGSPRVAIQLHGNDLLSCPDLFISNGTRFPGDFAGRLFARARERCGDLFIVDLADGSQSECAFSGGASVQAIFSNNCTQPTTPEACAVYAPPPMNGEQFISLEQSMPLRKDYRCLIQALKDIFP